MLYAFATLVILVMITLALWIIVTLGCFPAKLARENNHPQIDAINALSWLGLLTFGVLWVVALVWSQFKYSDEDSLLEKRITALEAELKAVQQEKEQQA
ncbi:MAG: DUF3302 domain-containing protein [Colwellia sp.]|nr:DUF3302 domain-containing protein [Colwellia sp.]